LRRFLSLWTHRMAFIISLRVHPTSRSKFSLRSLGMASSLPLRRMPSQPCSYRSISTLMVSSGMNFQPKPIGGPDVVDGLSLSARMYCRNSTLSKLTSFVSDTGRSSDDSIGIVVALLSSSILASDSRCVRTFRQLFKSCCRPSGSRKPAPMCLLSLPTVHLLQSISLLRLARRSVSTNAKPLRNVLIVIVDCVHQFEAKTWDFAG